MALGPDIESSSVRAALDPASVDTGGADRDRHLRGPGFLGVEAFPAWAFASTAAVPAPTAEGGAPAFGLEGEATIHGVTKPFSLRVAYLGSDADGAGRVIARFAASGELSRADFGIEWGGRAAAAFEVVADKVDVEIAVAAVLQV